MRLSLIALGSLLGLVLGVAASEARCLSYEPARVALSGTLVARILPGPPGYRNVSSGDYPETVYFLKLDEPICVSGDPSRQRNSKSHSGVEEVQIAAGERNLRAFVRKRVRAVGSLFGAHMSAHRTPVVLSLVSLHVLSGASPR